MAVSTRTQERLKIKDYKLNALLDITKAINSQLSVDGLLMQFENVLRQHLGLEKLILFTYEQKWKSLLHFGFDASVLPEFQDASFFNAKKEVTLNAGPRNEAFDLIIPVFHDNEPLAYVLVGDIGEQSIGMSPAIKHMRFIETLTNVLVVAIQNRKLQEASLQQERTRKELELAAEMQSILLPSSLPKNEYYEVSAVYKAHQQVGGDYYDFLDLGDDEAMFCMADVSGKGVSAAFLMANFQAYLRAIFSYSKSDLKSMVVELNKRVMNSAMGEKYITLFLATYNRKTRVLQYINCGHNPPVLADANGYTQLLKHGTIGLGMFEELPKLAMGEVIVHPDSWVVCFTDGLVETENEQNQEFGNERLEQLILANYKLSPNELNHLLLSNCTEFKGEMPFVDDLAILSCHIF
ncbi:MAG: PP2C family protein-serine/threonine phosphatase [Flavobacteriales bacterium]|nr:PP2C family protein-serine/threonine phosphatase [Flavobacteriales bacterium]